MSKVQICNRALSTYLGVGRINSLDETSAAAEQCNLHYDDTLKTLIEAHWWSFATGRQILAELTNDRETEWQFKYSRPADALMIRWVNDAQSARLLMSLGKSPDAPRDLTADHIYSNVQYATCEYTQLITDTTKFPQHFANALSAALAGNVAMSLTEDVRRAKNAMDHAEDRLDRAIALDERETPPIDYLTTPSWLEARGIS